MLSTAVSLLSNLSSISKAKWLSFRLLIIIILARHGRSGTRWCLDRVFRISVLFDNTS